MYMKLINNKIALKLSKNTLVKDTLVLSIGNIGSKVLVFFLLPFYTNFLTTEDYGKIGLINVFINLFIPVISLQAINGISRFTKSENKIEKKIYFTNISFYFLVIFFILSIGVSYISKMYFFKEINLILIFTLITTSFLKDYFSEFIRVQGKTVLYTKLSIIYTFSYCVLSIFLVKSLRVNGFLLSIVFASLLTILILVIKIDFRDYFKFKLRSMKKFKEVLKFTVPLIPTSIIWWIIDGSDKFLVKYYIGYDEVGIYNVATKIPAIIVIFYGFFIKSFQLYSIDYFENSSNKKIYNSIYRKNDLILFILSLMLIVINPYISKLLLKKEFYNAWKIAPVLFIGNYLLCLSRYFGVNYLVIKDTKRSFYTTVFAAGMNIFLNILTIPHFGILGASISTAISYFFLLIIRIKDSKLIDMHSFKQSFYYLTVLIFSSYFSMKKLYLEFLILFICLIFVSKKILVGEEK